MSAAAPIPPPPGVSPDPRQAAPRAFPHDTPGLSGPAPTAPRPTGERPPATGYVARHWRGELSLPRSFWVNNVLLDLLVVLLAVPGFYLVQRGVVVTGYRVLLGVMAAGLLLWPWQLAGCWRAADRLLGQGAPPLWPRLTQAALLAGVLVSVPTGPDDLDFYREALYFAASEDGHTRYEVSLGDDGTTLEVWGDFGWGLTKEVRRHLDGNPRVKTVRLTSDGGWILEGQRLYDLIRERELSTYASVECSSACTMAFLGGERRELGAGGVLGFHRPSAYDGDKFGPEERFDAERDFYLEAGVAPDFVERTFATPSDDMWYPTPDELLDAGVITGLTPGDGEG